ncbi:MAG: glycoside hydrolase family 88 protein [Blautia sp.]|nr:glycoside hydrolase family 88 protein [Blautia sp.]
MIDRETASSALFSCIGKVEASLDSYNGLFPGPASKGLFYQAGENRGWTTGFFTGEVWLSFENLPEGERKTRFLNAALSQVDSFLERIENHVDVDHHDMGFLYSPSCVAAYRLTGSENGKKAALLAADQLISRFQEKGGFLQAWGEMGAPDNYRFIIDCLLNLPLLYWASDQTGKPGYREIAEKHIHTAMSYVIREDDSTWHTVFMNPVTGGFDHGATCQGYKDGSAWARGQAWGIYGTAVAYKYTLRPEYFDYFRRVTSYFLAHLPKDLCPFWDLTFGDGDEETEPRDSSSAVIASCGMLEMSKYLPEEEAAYYTSIARRLLMAMVSKYQSRDFREAGGLLLHGTYSKKSPYNTCTPEGVDECVIWGDYFFMEALQRFLKPAWEIYW